MGLLFTQNVSLLPLPCLKFYPWISFFQLSYTSIVYHHNRRNKVFRQSFNKKSLIICLPQKKIIYFIQMGKKNKEMPGQVSNITRIIFPIVSTFPLRKRLPIMPYILDTPNPLFQFPLKKNSYLQHQLKCITVPRHPTALCVPWDRAN